MNQRLSGSQINTNATLNADNGRGSECAMANSGLGRRRKRSKKFNTQVLGLAD